MARISAQVSLYPLRQARLSPAIDEALQVFRSHKLEVQPGRMSTIILGEERELFAGLQEAFRRAASHGDLVMTVSLSNACPAAIPSQGSSK
jgi:uncharacterized protein YqgV (UPF0045/DUF77 family)